MFSFSARPSAEMLAAFAGWIFLIGAALAATGCKHIEPLDTKPLDAAGMNYDAIKQLVSLKITAPEIAEMAKARRAGFSDPSCVQAFHIYQDRDRPFDGGDAIAGMLQVRMSEETILELARLNQLGLNAGEYQAMRLAGLPEAIILEVARHRAFGKPVLSGPSLATLKNTGMRDSTMLELARRGVPDSQLSAIVTARRHGEKDAQILRRFTGF